MFMAESGFGLENSASEFEKLNYSDQRLSLKQSISLTEYTDYLNENKDLIQDYLTGDFNEDTFLSLDIRYKAIEILTIARLLILKSFDIHSVEYNGRFPEYSYSELSLIDNDGGLRDGLLPLFSVLKLKSNSSVGFININGEKVYDIESDMFGVEIDFQSNSPSARINDQNGDPIKAVKVRSIWLRGSHVSLDINEEIYVPIEALEMSSELVDFRSKLDVTGDEARVFQVLQEHNFQSDLSGDALREFMFTFFCTLLEQNSLSIESHNLLFDFFLQANVLLLLRNEHLFRNPTLSERILTTLKQNNQKLKHADFNFVFNIFEKNSNLEYSLFEYFLKLVPSFRFELISKAFHISKDKPTFRNCFKVFLTKVPGKVIWVMNNLSELLRVYNKEDIKELIWFYGLSESCIARYKSELYLLFEEDWLKSFNPEISDIEFSVDLPSDIISRITAISHKFVSKYSINKLRWIVQECGLANVNKILNFLEFSDENIRFFEMTLFTTEQMVIMLEMDLFNGSRLQNSVFDFQLPRSFMDRPFPGEKRVLFFYGLCLASGNISLFIKPTSLILKSLDFSPYEYESALNKYVLLILNKVLLENPDLQLEFVSFAKDNFKSDNNVLARFSSMALVGLGLNAHDFTVNELKVIASNLSLDANAQISDLITSETFEIVSESQFVNLPMSVFFSMLQTIKQSSDTNFVQVLRDLVSQFDRIQYESVISGSLFVFSYKLPDSLTPDYNPSYLDSTARTWSSVAFDSFANRQDGVLNKSFVFSGEEFHQIKRSIISTGGDLTLVFGGHGEPEYISMGQGHTSEFNMRSLFSALEERLTHEPTQTTTKIIFQSCFSDENIEILNKMIAASPVCQRHNFIMISSSNQHSPYLKIANDSWLSVSRSLKSRLNFQRYFTLIESRNFILPQNTYNHESDTTFNNSNMTLYINGQKLF